MHPVYRVLTTVDLLNLICDWHPVETAIRKKRNRLLLDWIKSQDVHICRGDTYKNDYIYNLLCAAAESNNIEAMERFSKYARSYKICYQGSWDKIIAYAATAGNLGVIKWIYANLSEYCCETDAFQSAVLSGHLDIVKWMHENVDSNYYTVTPYAIQYAASSGNLELVQWMHQNCKWWCNERVTQNAAEKGYLHIIKWVCANCGKVQLDYTAYVAANNGYFEIVKWIYENSGYLDCYAIDSAAAWGNLDMVKWIYANVELATDYDKKSTALKHAAQKGHMDVVEWLCENKIPGCSSPDDYGMALRRAAASGYLEIVKYLYNKLAPSADQRVCKADARTAIIKAATNCQLAVVKWLHSLGYEVALYYTGEAILNARLDVLEWFHANGQHINMDNIMRCAVDSGHIHVMEWLYKTYGTEIMTSDLIDRAARDGNIDALRWLHSKNYAMCSPDAMESAAKFNYIEVVKLISQNITTNYTEQGIVSAAISGNLEIVKWLHYNCRAANPLTSSDIDTICKNEHLGILKWLKSKNYIHNYKITLENCSQISDVRIIKWLYSNNYLHIADIEAFVHNACLNNYVDNLEFIKELVPFQIKPQTLIDIIRNGNLGVVKWICRNMPESKTLFDSTHIELAEAYCKRNIAAWLMEYLRSVV